MRGEDWRRFLTAKLDLWTGSCVQGKAPRGAALNPVDRFQAMIRHSDYRADKRRKGLLKFDLARRDLRALFAVSGPPIQNDRDRWLGCWDYQQFLVLWGLAHGVDDKNPKEVTATLKALNAGDSSLFTDDLRGYDVSQGAYPPDSEYEHVFHINVDLQRPTAELLPAIRKLIDTERRGRRIQLQRTRPHKADPWKVWDAKHELGSSLLKIARERYKLQLARADDQKLKEAYNMVQHSYAKAASMIEAVGRSRKTGPLSGPASAFACSLADICAALPESHPLLSSPPSKSRRKK